MIQLLATLTPLLAPAPSVASPAIAPPRAQDGGAETRWYDIRSIPTPLDTDEPGVLMGLPVTTAKHEDLEPDSHDVPLPEDVVLELQTVLDAVERAIEADPETEVDALDLFNGRIRVTGNQRAQERAARAVSALRTLANDAARVEIVELPADGVPPGAGPLLTPGEVASLLERLPGQPSLTATAPMGRRTVVGAGRTTTFLAGYDVEVAQSSMIADPVVSVIRSGLDVGLRLDRASDGRRVVLRAWGRDARLRTPIRKRAQEGFAGAEIELPEADATLFAGSALVEPGGGILVRCGGAAGGVLIRVLSGAGSGLPAESIAVGEHLVGSMRPDPPYFTPAEPSRGWSPPDESLAEATRPWESDAVSAFDFADRVLGLHRIANGLISLGGTALYMGPDDRRSELRTGFDEYGAAAPVHTFALEAAHRILTAEEAAALAASGDVMGFVRGATRVQGTVLEGDAMVLLGGAEAAYLKDYDAQIANGAAIHDPIVSAVFGGFSLWASPIEATESGGMRAWIDVQRQTFEDTLREIPVSNFRADDPDDDSPPRVSGTYTTDLSVELPDTHRASARSVVSLEPDAWSLVAVQPMSDDGRCFVVAARARASR